MKKTAKILKKPKTKKQKKPAVRKPTVKAEQILLRLYITGTTPQSQRALANIKRICDEHLEGAYELQVVDIYQSPQLAKDEQIIAAPTLVKVLPSPLRRLIGDLSDEQKVLLGLDVRPKTRK